MLLANNSMIKQSKSLQLRRRYLLISNANKSNLDSLLLKSLGSLGYAKALPVYIEEKGQLLLAVERTALNEVRSALELAKSNMKILKVAGTIKSLGIK